MDRKGKVEEMQTPNPTLPPPPSEPRRPLWPRFLLLTALLLAVAAFYFFGAGDYLSWESVRANLDGMKVWTQEHLILAVALFFFVYVSVTALSLPAATVLTLLAGALFERWLGTAVVSVASTLGATLAFLAARYLFRDAVRRRLGERLRSLDRGVEVDGAYYLLTLRLVPAAPFFLVNLGMALTPIRVRTFVWVSWLGMLPATFLYVSAGTALAGLRSPRDALSWEVLLSLALLGVVPLLLRLLLGRRGFR